MCSQHVAQTHKPRAPRRACKVGPTVQPCRTCMAIEERQFFPSRTAWQYEIMIGAGNTARKQPSDVQHKLAAHNTSHELRSHHRTPERSPPGKPGEWRRASGWGSLGCTGGSLMRPGAVREPLAWGTLVPQAARTSLCHGAGCFRRSRVAASSSIVARFTTRQQLNPVWRTAPSYLVPLHELQPCPMLLLCAGGSPRSPPQPGCARQLPGQRHQPDHGAVHLPAAGGWPLWPGTHLHPPHQPRPEAAAN